jgi:hypothetical protein
MATRDPRTSVCAIAMAAVFASAAAGHAQICPALSSLASSCRDGVCRGDAGETAANCPEDCADTNAQVKAYYTQGITCPGTTIYEPKTVAEVQSTVRTLVSSGRKIRVGGTSHSATDIICADTNGDVVRTKFLKGIGPVEASGGYAKTVLVEAGVTFVELQEYLHGLGYSFGLATPGYGGISIAGAIATGAHGSSQLASSTISSYVIGIDLVGPNGNVTTYTEGTTGVSNPNLWKALKTNLGLLGIVVRIRLKLENQFNVRVEVREVPESSFVAANGVANAVMGCDYVFLTWFPGHDTVQYLCGIRTAAAVDSPFAQNRLFTPQLSGFEQAFAITTLQFGMCDHTTECSTEGARLSNYDANPPLVITSNATPSATVVSRHTALTGYAHRMITLQPQVFAQQPALSQLEYEGAIPFSQIQAAVQYLQSIYNRDDVCQPLIGTIMRFDVADGNLLLSANHARAGVAAGEKMVHLEFVEYWGYGLNASGLQSFVSNPYTEIVQHLSSNFNYWPHWGKNDEWVFTQPAIMSRNATERATFNAQIASLDPYGVFSNASSRRNGFVSPNEGGSFKAHYYGSCASADNDADGISNCYDLTPSNFSGVYARIDDDGVLSGTCDAADTWTEMSANFGADQEGYKRRGWDYENNSHAYYDSKYEWVPAWSSSGGNSWEVMMSAQMTPTASGTYCFGQNIGSSGNGIVAGVNSCGQIWINKAIVSEVGYGGSNTYSGCLSMTAGTTYRLDIYDRHHDANLTKSFISHPRWCYGGSSTCTPDRKFEQNQLKAIATL